MTSTFCRRLAAASIALALPVATACAAEPRSADPDPDRIAVNPPSDGAGHTHAPGQSEPTPVGDGTRASAGGYRLVGVRLPRRTDGPGEMSFLVRGPDGSPVTDYTPQQTELMHLYVVRTDYSVFRHLHPVLGRDGTWTVPVDLPERGGYRMVADFLPADAERPVILGRQVLPPSDGSRSPVPAADDSDNGVVRVRVDGPGRVGADGRLHLVVSTPDGDPVALGSYLGTSAHVSGFRSGGRARDQVFVHVHPYGAPEQTADGTRLTFHTRFDRAGDYRLFVQVRVDGVLHTVAVTATVAAD